MFEIDEFADHRFYKVVQSTKAMMETTEVLCAMNDVDRKLALSILPTTIVRWHFFLSVFIHGREKEIYDENRKYDHMS